MTSQQDGKWEPYNFVQVTDNHIYMISHVDSLFSDNQSLFLRQVLELLKEISQQADQGEVPEAKQSVEKLVKLVATSSYPTHESPMQSGRDRDEWFNEKILIILQLLSEKTNKQGMDAAG